jgi:hypothetical protein
MFKQTMAALGGMCVDVGAFSGALIVETTAAACELTSVTAGAIERAAGTAHGACAFASEGIENWRVNKKDQLQEWAYRSEAEADARDTSDLGQGTCDPDIDDDITAKRKAAAAKGAETRRRNKAAKDAAAAAAAGAAATA